MDSHLPAPLSANSGLSLAFYIISLITASPIAFKPDPNAPIGTQCCLVFAATTKQKIHHPKQRPFTIKDDVAQSLEGELSSLGAVWTVPFTLCPTVHSILQGMCGSLFQHTLLSAPQSQGTLPFWSMYD
jgi:hypothetical protein